MNKRAHNTWRASCGCLCLTVRQRITGHYVAVIEERGCDDDRHEHGNMFTSKREAVTNG